jgi:hypothetical protein
LRQKQNAAKRKYVKKMKALPKTDLKIGDPCPTDSNLFVVFFTGNKAFFGTREDLEKKKKCLRRSGVLRDIKYMHKRRGFLKGLKERLKRGAIHPETGKVFWIYSKNTKEIWMDVEEFNIKHRIEKERRKRTRLKRKMKELSSSTNKDIIS